MTAAQSVAAHLERIDLSRATLELVADDFRVSPNTLRRRLRECGETFLQLKNAERIRRLEERRGTIGKVMHDVTGHADANGFYRWHKAQTGKGWRRLDANFR